MPLAKLSLMLVMHVSNDVTKSSPRKSNGIKFSVIVGASVFIQGYSWHMQNRSGEWDLLECIQLQNIGHNGMRVSQITTLTHLWCLWKKHWSELYISSIIFNPFWSHSSNRKLVFFQQDNAHAGKWGLGSYIPDIAAVLSFWSNQILAEIAWQEETGTFWGWPFL